MAIALEATSVVALIDRESRRVVIATDCRVNRTVGSSSECKIIDENDCTVAIAGLYREPTTFDVRRLVDSACKQAGDLRAKADAFVHLARPHYEQAICQIRKAEGSAFGLNVRNKATEVIFAGLQDGNVALILRGLLTDSTGKISVERSDSIAPTYARIGFFLGLNGHIRSYIRSHPDWAAEDFVKLGRRFVEMEMEAHPDLAGPPISEVQIDNDGHVHWLDKGACDNNVPGGTTHETIGK